MKAITFRLSLMNFLEFAIWGAYLTCLANYLGPAGISNISIFYAVQGIVSIFMPAIVGVIADKWIQPQRMLGICHFLAALFMGGAWWYGFTHPQVEFKTFFTLYTLSVAFFMPTIALSNTVAFSVLKRAGKDTVKDFPPIRVLGTVGFIAAMWFVNSFYIMDGTIGFSLSNPAATVEAPNAPDPRFQYTVYQLLVSSILGFILAVYSFVGLPDCPLSRGNRDKQSLASIFGLDAFKLFKRKKMAIFFIFSMLLGVSLQITNGYATPFISSFKAMSDYIDSFGANNATLLTSLSQISEACCILLIPFCLKRFGIKRVMMMAMFAWVLRFGFFGFGNPGSGVWLFILSMLVYGVAFDFFNVSGALFVSQETDDKIQASAQGLFMLMTNGLGASIGMIAAGAIVDANCHWHKVGGQNYLLGDWPKTWFIFAAYALVVLVLFTIFFKYKHKPENMKAIHGVVDDVESAPEGFVSNDSK